MKRSGMLRPTCCEIVPGDRTAFETYTTIYHYTPQLHKLFVGGWRFTQSCILKFRQSILLVLSGRNIHAQLSKIRCS